MHQRGCAVGCLHQIGKNRIGEQRHHSAGGAQVFRPDRVTTAIHTDEYGVEPLPQIGAALRERHDGHHFARGGDHKSGAASRAVFLAIERDGDLAQRAVVHIHRARPADTIRIEMQIVAVKKVRVDERGQQILRGRNRVKIAMKMEIDLFARLDLRKAPARGASLDAEHRTQRRFARSENGLFADQRQALCQTNGCNRLAFAGNRGRGSGNEDQFATPRKRRIIEKIDADLRAVGSDRLEIALG